MLRFAAFIFGTLIFISFFAKRNQVLRNGTIISRDKFLIILPSLFLLFHQTIFKFSHQLMPSLSLVIIFLIFSIYLYHDGLFRRSRTTAFILFIFIASNFVGYISGEFKQSINISVLHSMYFLLFSCLFNYVNENKDRFIFLLHGLKLSMYMSMLFGIFEIIIKGLVMNGLAATLLLLRYGAKHSEISSLAYKDHGQLVTMLTGEGLAFASFYICLLPFLFFFSDELRLRPLEKIMFVILGLFFLMLISARGPLLVFIFTSLLIVILHLKFKQILISIGFSFIIMFAAQDYISYFMNYIVRTFTDYEAKIIPVFGLVYWDHSLVEKILPLLTLITKPVVFLVPNFSPSHYNKDFGVFGVLGLISCYSPLIMIVFSDYKRLKIKKNLVLPFIVSLIPFVYVYLVVSYAFVVMIGFGSEFDKINSVFMFYGGVYLILLNMFFLPWREK